MNNTSQARAAPRLVGVGAVFIDDIVLPDGEIFSAQLGGGVVHALMGAVVWDEYPGLVAVMGHDLPQPLYAHLQRYVDTSGLHRLDVPQIRAWQFFQADGARREIYPLRDPRPFIVGAQPEHLPECFDHSQGFYLLQDFDGLRAWRSKVGGFVLWEPAQQIMIPGNREPLCAVLQNGAVNLISPNLLEAQAIYGEQSPEELAAAFIKDGAQAVALRLGEHGSYIASGVTGEQAYIPAVPVQRVVDQTGAGNTYCGGLLCGILQGKSLREAALMGAVSASFCIEQIGPIDPARIDRVERDRRLARYWP